VGREPASAHRAGAGFLLAALFKDAGFQFSLE
jgi:hypothetical protein